MHGMNNNIVKNAGEGFQLCQNLLQLEWRIFRLVLLECNTVPVCTGHGALWGGGGAEKTFRTRQFSRHGGRPTAVCNHSSALRRHLNCAQVCPRFIILHDVGWRRSQNINLVAVGALDTAGQASRSSQNWVLGSGGTWRYAVSRQYQPTYLHCNSVSQKLLLADNFWFRKIITDPRILAHIHIENPDFCTFSEPCIVIHIREKDQQDAHYS